MTDWTRVHRAVIEAFTAGWDAPGPHAWDALLADDVELVQPMLSDGRGRELWWDEASRLMALLPDLRGEVLDWSAAEGTIFIHVGFTATLAGRPFCWRAVDHLRVDESGALLRRESFFDSVPVALALLRRPRAWPAWWRSGIAPAAARRRLMRSPVRTNPTKGSP
jgi:hypothetical protein